MKLCPHEQKIRDENPDMDICVGVCDKCSLPNTPDNEILKEFDKKSDPDTYEIGEYHRLKNAEDSLLDSSWYPESPYELDRDRVREFLISKLTLARKEAREELLTEIERVMPKEQIRSEKCRSCGGEGETGQCKGGSDWERCDGFNDALSQIKTALSVFKKQE